MAKKNENYLHVIRTQIKNFKGIREKEVEFDGRSALIIGPNDTGKSSLIQAVMSPLNSKFVPLEPVTKGEDRGHIELELSGRIDGEDVTYSVKTFFSPGHEKGRLVIENGMGQKINGGFSMLQTIIGNIGFDIDDFIRMGRTPSGGVSKEGIKKQIEVLKSLLSHEDQKAIYQLDKEYKEKYDERTEINRNVLRIEKNIETLKSGLTQEDVVKYEIPLDTDTIFSQLQVATKHNGNVDTGIQAKEKLKTEISDLDTDICSLESKLDAARKAKIDKSNELDKVRLWLDKNSKKDITAISDQFKTISEHNDKSQKISDVNIALNDLDLSKIDSQNITDRLIEIQKEKKDVFANSSLPIKGLEFNDEMITYNGLPLDSDQISTAKLLGIGLKIGMAYNPNLRLLVIRDGSLLDKQMLEFILKICAEQNYQVLIEMVSFERDKNEIRFIEKSIE